LLWLEAGNLRIGHESNYKENTLSNCEKLVMAVKKKSMKLSMLPARTVTKLSGIERRQLASDQKITIR